MYKRKHLRYRAAVGIVPSARLYRTLPERKIFIRHDKIGTVSYTHLDVYKRQELICGVNSCNCGNADADFYEYWFDCARAGRRVLIDKLFDRGLYLCSAKFFECRGMGFVFARCSLVELKDSHSPVFAWTVHIESRALSISEINAFVFYDKAVVVIVTDIYAEDIALFAQRLKFAVVYICLLYTSISRASSFFSGAGSIS